MLNLTVIVFIGELSLSNLLTALLHTDQHSRTADLKWAQREWDGWAWSTQLLILLKGY